MFGLSWGQIAIIGLVAVFLLGPERIPTAVSWIMSTLRKLRTMAAGAQAELRKEIGPELDELRRQVADLQSLKEVQELRELRELHPKRIIGRNVLGDQFSGGISGFLGLNGETPGNSGSSPAADTAPPGPSRATPPPAVPANGSAGAGAAPANSLGGSTAGAPANGSPPPPANGQEMPTAAAAPAPKPAAVAPGSPPPFDPDGT